MFLDINCPLSENHQEKKMDNDINYASIVEANVYLREQFAGVLQKIDIGYQFTYAQTWLNGQHGPISISLPSTKIVHYSVELFPFFDNLIPEGWLLSYVQDIHRIDKGNRFALLMATGRYPIGAVSVIPLKDSKELHILDNKKFFYLEIKKKYVRTIASSHLFKI